MATLSDNILDNLFEEIGLGPLLPQTKDAYKEHIYKELELRTGVKLVPNMSDEQIKAVMETLEEIKEELRQHKDRLKQSPIIPEEDQTTSQSRLDDAFFEKHGFSEISEEKKDKIRRRFDHKLQLGVGEQLADGMPREKLHEFDIFSEERTPEGAEWLEKNVPDYKNSVVFKELLEEAANTAGFPVESFEEFFANENFIEEWITFEAFCKCVTTIISVLGSQQWLILNRPDYLRVVNEVEGRLKREIIDDPDYFLRDSSEEDYL